jgi:hypothetical protein
MFGLILALIMFVALAVGCVFAAIDEKKNTKKQPEEIEEIDDEREPEFVSVGAKVLGKGGFHKYYGTKYVNYTLLLRVAFLTDEGEELVFEIPQEIYDRIEEGQYGTLITVNGNFFDFGDGEEISE